MFFVSAEFGAIAGIGHDGITIGAEPPDGWSADGMRSVRHCTVQA
jgi:hypothetical protein